MSDRAIFIINFSLVLFTTFSVSAIYWLLVNSFNKKRAENVLMSVKAEYHLDDDCDEKVLTDCLYSHYSSERISNRFSDLFGCFYTIFFIFLNTLFLGAFVLTCIYLVLCDGYKNSGSYVLWLFVLADVLMCLLGLSMIFFSYMIFGRFPSEAKLIRNNINAFIVNKNIASQGTYLLAVNLSNLYRLIKNYPLYLKINSNVDVFVKENLFDDSCTSGISALTKKTKDILCAEVKNKINLIIQSENPILSNRLWFADCVCDMTTYGVVIIPPAPEIDDTCMRGYRGVTGDLKAHLDSILKSKYFSDYFQGVEVSQIGYDLVMLCYWRAWFYASASDIVRVCLQDCISPNDWGKQFVKCMYAYNEAQIRKAIGLPEILNEHQEKTEFLFLHLVINGVKDPSLDYIKLKKALEFIDET